jgi:hypothetical protein
LGGGERIVERVMRALDRDTEPLGHGREGEVLGATGLRSWVYMVSLLLIQPAPADRTPLIRPRPIMDDHFVYAIVLVGLILANAGRHYGMGKVWQRYGLVQDRRYLY